MTTGKANSHMIEGNIVSVRSTSEEMTDEPKLEEHDSSSPNGIDNSIQSASKTSIKSKSRNEDKASPSAASAKRRCVSTACIACRKRKSKAYITLMIPNPYWLTPVFHTSAMETPLAALLALLSMAQTASTTRTPIIAARVFTRKTSITSRPEILHFKR